MAVIHKLADTSKGQMVVELVDVAAIAHRLGTTPGAVHQLRRRHDDFPEPVATLAIGPVWWWQDVATWAAIPRKPGRPRKD